VPTSTHTHTHTHIHTHTHTRTHTRTNTHLFEVGFNVKEIARQHHAGASSNDERDEDLHARHMARRRIHACHMQERIHACHMRKWIHACASSNSGFEFDKDLAEVVGSVVHNVNNGSEARSPNAALLSLRQLTRPLCCVSNTLATR
jgi:hypothetical protein